MQILREYDGKKNNYDFKMLIRKLNEIFSGDDSITPFNTGVFDIPIMLPFTTYTTIIVTASINCIKSSQKVNNIKLRITSYNITVL